MSNEKLSILLETVSFFLVTLDLFGKERLGKLYEQLVSRLEGMKKRRVAQPFLAYLHKNKMAGAIYSLSLVVMGLVLSDWILMKMRYSLPNNVFANAFAVAGVIAFSATIVTLFVVLMPFFLENLLDLTLGSIVRLLDRYKLEGLMLTIGAVLFLASKAVAFFG